MTVRAQLAPILRRWSCPVKAAASGRSRLRRAEFDGAEEVAAEGTERGHEVAADDKAAGTTIGIPGTPDFGRVVNAKSCEGSLPPLQVNDQLRERVERVGELRIREKQRVVFPDRAGVSAAACAGLQITLFHYESRVEAEEVRYRCGRMRQAADLAWRWCW